MSAAEPELIGPASIPGAKVCVIVTTYNDELSLLPTMRAILEQKLDDPFIVIVHDDGSTDSTPAILRELAEEFDNLRLVLHPDNRTSAGDYGAAVTMASLPAPYVAFCEGDDVWIDDHKLAKQLDFMERNGWCTISHHAVEVAVEGGSEAYAQELRDYLSRSQSTQPRTPGVSLGDGNSLMTCAVMVRTSALRPQVLRAMYGMVPEDYAIHSLAAEFGDIGYLPDVMARYRLDGHNFWAELTPLEREGFEVEVLWFMSCHLRGPLQRRSQERLLDSLCSVPAEIALEPVRRHRAELTEARSEVTKLRALLTESHPPTPQTD